MLSSIQTQAVTQPQSLGCGAEGGPHFSTFSGTSSPRGLIFQTTCRYATQKPVQQSQEDDPPLPMLLKDYQNVPGIDIDDVMKRLLSLEMANKKEMLKIKKGQLMSKVVENLKDTSSLEAQIAALTVKIWSYEEHMQKC